MKLLVIDDNRSLAWRLQNYMSKQFVLEAAHTAAEGITLALNTDYDAIILDLGLPDKSGEDVCRILREKGLAIPILILTAEKAVHATVSLLESGADDYMTKPFKITELQARLQALSRRGRLSSKQIKQVVIGDLTLDLEHRVVKRAGQEIKLRRKEFDILEYLVVNRGRILTRPMILGSVWQNDSEAWNNTIDVHIKSLRDKIDRPFKKPLIKTAHGLGYMLDAR